MGLEEDEGAGGIVHLHVQALPLPVLPLVLPDKGKEASAEPPEEDPADSAVLQCGGTTQKTRPGCTDLHC